MKAKSAKTAVKTRAAETNADPVRDFYTSHPFPPPIENLDRAREMWRDENIHRAEHHLLWPEQEYRADLDVLIAGCGTWQAAKYAIGHPKARVVGIDVSSTSLEHTQRLKQNHDLTNLEAKQLAVENAEQLDQQFDLIICTGVLHHLVDPDAGLRALRSVLKPDGAMNLMVYAPYGRDGVYMIQEYCRRLGVGTSPEEIQDLMTVLRYLPDHHPLLATQGGSRQFPNADALADAVLNPRDRSYSVSQLFDFVESNGLQLSRWHWQAAYLPQCGFISSSPHASKLSALPEREQYIEMELLRGRMANHSFIAHRNDRKNNGAKVTFDDERYLRYVPIRLPWTMCATEGLPPGFAGALVNQTHIFDDLYVLVNDQEKQLWEAIDGRRTVSEIVESIPLAREFFEKLWCYDQVVFDTSKAV
jgi:SAM-dependent methyltransferase